MKNGLMEKSVEGKKDLDSKQELKQLTYNSVEDFIYTNKSRSKIVEATEENLSKSKDGVIKKVSDKERGFSFVLDPNPNFFKDGSFAIIFLPDNEFSFGVMWSDKFLILNDIAVSYMESSVMNKEKFDFKDCWFTMREMRSSEKKSDCGFYFITDLKFDFRKLNKDCRFLSDRNGDLVFDYKSNDEKSFLTYRNKTCHE